MGLIAIVLLVIFVISALVLMLVILVQDDQGEGLGGIFGAGSSSAFGPRSGNVLTRFTSVVAAVFLATAFMLAFVNRTPRGGDLLERARAQQLQSSGQTEWWKNPEAGGTGAPEAAPQPETGTAPQAEAPQAAAPQDGAPVQPAPAQPAP